MAEIHGAGGPLPHIPDDLTIVQFMLDHQHPSQPVAKGTNTWLIEDATGRKIGFEEIRSRTNALANAIAARWKIEYDDVACVFSPNHVDYPVMLWALHRIGVTVTTANPAYTADELVHQLKTTATKLILVHPWNYATAVTAAKTVGIPSSNIILLEPLPNTTGGAQKQQHATVPELIAGGARAPKSYTERKLAPGEARTKIALLCFSSGTTGLPKAVAIPHYALIANVIQIAAYANSDEKPWETKSYRPGDVALAVLPFYHGYGLAYIMHFVLFYRMTLVVIPKFDFVNMLKSIQQYRINYVPVVPPMIVLFCKHPDVKKFDLSSVRAIVSGAAPLSAEMTQQLATVLPDVSISQGYGMTEMSVIVAMPRLDKKIATPGSSGIIIPGVTARVERSNGSLAPRGEPGELVVTGPAVALGYYKNERATKETFVDGWVRTGDEVIIDENGELFIVDRIKELLKVKGFQVAPAELEGFLLDHPDVSDVCVVSILDDFSGDLPLAYVVPSAAAQQRIEANPAEADRIRGALIKYVADGKVAYKQLTAGVEFIDAIPKNPSGKLLRRFLREQARKKGQLAAAPLKAKL